MVSRVSDRVKVGCCSRVMATSFKELVDFLCFERRDSGRYWPMHQLGLAIIVFQE